MVAEETDEALYILSFFGRVPSVNGKDSSFVKSESQARELVSEIFDLGHRKVAFLEGDAASGEVEDA